MEHELECPKCNHKFFISEDYQVDDCPNCGKSHYYWDYVLDEETKVVQFYLDDKTCDNGEGYWLDFGRGWWDNFIPTN